MDRFHCILYIRCSDVTRRISSQILMTDHQFTQMGKIWYIFCEFKFWFTLYHRQCSVVCNIQYYVILNRVITPDILYHYGNTPGSGSLHSEYRLNLLLSPLVIFTPTTHVGIASQHHPHPLYWLFKKDLGLCLPRENISTLCVISIWRNDSNCEHMFMFLMKIIACKVLNSTGAHLRWTLVYMPISMQWLVSHQQLG